MIISVIQQLQGDSVISTGLYINYTVKWWHVAILIILIAAIIYRIKRKKTAK